MVMTDALTWQQQLACLLPRASSLCSVLCKHAEAQCEDDAYVCCIAKGET